MDSKVGHQPSAFVIRLWLEPREASAAPHWRWRVVHVQSGAGRYGERWAELLSFIADRAEVESGIPSPGAE